MAESTAGDAWVDASGQPAGDPIEMAKVNGYCPFISSTTVVMIPQGSALQPGQQRQVAPAVMPMFAPCIGERCAVWFKGMCSIKSLAFDMRQVGNHLDKEKYRGV